MRWTVAAMRHTAFVLLPMLAEVLKVSKENRTIARMENARARENSLSEAQSN